MRLSVVNAILQRHEPPRWSRRRALLRRHPRIPIGSVLSESHDPLGQDHQEAALHLNDAEDFKSFDTSMILP